jgi:hypothetical protein
MTKGKGLYLGTEMDEKWWKRYKKDKFLARGNGKYWYDDQGFYFHRYLTKNPLYIPWSVVTEIKLGKSHAGRRFARMSVLKIVWTRDDMRLSSGFLVSKHEIDARNLLAELMQVCGATRK